jgi:hypothetical protein
MVGALRHFVKLRPIRSSKSDLTEVKHCLAQGQYPVTSRLSNFRDWCDLPLLGLSRQGYLALSVCPICIAALAVCGI